MKILKNKLELKEIFQNQVITIIWGLFYFIFLSIALKINFQIDVEGFDTKLKLEEFITNFFPTIFGGFISTLYLNSYFKNKEKDLKNNIIKFVLSLLFSMLVYFFLVRNNFRNVIYMTRYISIILLIIIAYFYLEIKRGKSFKEMLTRTIVHLNYCLIVCFLLGFLHFSIYILLKISIPYYIAIYIYSLVPIIFFMLYQEDKKEYKLVEKTLNKIYIFFLGILVVLMYANIFMYGRTNFHIITHFIFWTGYIILFINISFKNRKIAFIMLPLAIFLIYKISDRIYELGLTESRYFILTYGLLLLFMYIIQIVKPNFNEEKYLALIIILSFITIFIPKINAFDMSRANLVKRANLLASKLERQLANNEVISYKDREEIMDYYYYFANRDYEAEFVDFINNNTETFIAYHSVHYDENIETVSIETEEFWNKMAEEGISIKGYEKLFYKHISLGDSPRDSEDYRILEEIFIANSNIIEKENQKIIVQYAYISKDKKEGTYSGHAQIYILKK